jgi:hypothetical protein
LAELAKKAMLLKEPATFFKDVGAHPSALGRQIPCMYAKASEVESLTEVCGQRDRLSSLLERGTK